MWVGWAAVGGGKVTETVGALQLQCEGRRGVGWGGGPVAALRRGRELTGGLSSHVPFDAAGLNKATLLCGGPGGVWRARVTDLRLARGERGCHCIKLDAGPHAQQHNTFVGFRPAVTLTRVTGCSLALPIPRVSDPPTPSPISPPPLPPPPPPAFYLVTYCCPHLVLPSPRPTIPDVLVLRPVSDACIMYSIGKPKRKPCRCPAVSYIMLDTHFFTLHALPPQTCWCCAPSATPILFYY